MPIKIKSKTQILDEYINDNKNLLYTLENSLIDVIKESISLIQNKELLNVLYDFIIKRIDQITED